MGTVAEAVESVARIKEIDRTYCRRHVERYFTVDRMIDEYIQVYEMMLKGQAHYENALSNHNPF